MRRIPDSVALIVAIAVLAGVVALSLVIGAADHPTREIVWNLRLPRALLAALVGAALATAGAIFQGLFRNPLADPFVIGVSGGSALGAVAAIVFGVAAIVPGTALAGGLAAAFIVYRIARVHGRVPLSTLLLAGFAVGSLASALLTILLVLRGNNWGDVLLWLMGNLNHTDCWARLRIMGPATAIALVIAIVYARDLNVLLLGEESAQQLGVDVERAKKMLLFAGAIATAGAVASAGIVGFVGLVVPNLARRLVGPDHRTMLPLAAVGGALLVAAADLAARSVMIPLELPIGSITALAGAPFFLIVLRRRSAA